MTVGANTLRVGLLVGSLRQPAWIRRLVDEIQASDVARIALVARNALTGSPAADRGALLYTLYMRLDAWVFPARPDPFQPSDVSGSLPDVPVIDVAPRRRGYVDELNDADIDRLLAHRLDVALCLDFGMLRGRALSIARHGVWAYRHGDELRCGGPPGFWEVMDGHPTTGAVLKILSAEQRDRVIYRSQSVTNTLSVSQNRLSSYWKSSTFVMRKLRDLHRDGDVGLERGATEETRAPTPRAHTPANATMARLIGRLAARYVGSQLRARIQYQQWTLAYRLFAGRTKDDAPDLELGRFCILEPPADRFWADPFVAHANDRHYILFEDCGYAPRRGRISVLELTADGTLSDPVPVLERDYHLSYPFLFTWQGEHYMIPESSANRTVDVYRATRFPYEWTPEITLFAGRHLVDVTLHELDGRWWMFANAPATPEVKYESWAWDELHIFYADSPLGPWHAHPQNPVVSDVRRARPAGRLFHHGGAWYRPAQDCGGGYGRRLVIQRIVRLDTTDYEEVPAMTLTPAWRRGLDGIHTINAAAGLTVVDVRRRRWKSLLY